MSWVGPTGGWYQELLRQKSLAEEARDLKVCAEVHEEPVPSAYWEKYPWCATCGSMYHKSDSCNEG